MPHYPPAHRRVTMHSTRHATANPLKAMPYAAPKPAFGVRVADIAALKDDGSTVIGQRKIPTLPVFDQTFGALAQGSLLKTETGYTAVEDLQPGDWVMTHQGTSEQIIWIGSATFAPSDQGERMQLTRIMADSFGMNRPESFVSLGSAARMLQTPPDLRGSAAAALTMTPASRFQDGVHVIEVTPPTPIRLFHVGLRSHSALIVNGLHIESFHPGSNPVAHLSQTLRTAYLTLFPHVQQLADLGPMRFTRAPEDQSLAQTG